MNKNVFLTENGVLVKYNGKDDSVVIPDGVTRIGNYAFSLCRTMESVTFPESVTSVGEYAFFDCSALDTFNIPSELKGKTDPRVFTDCPSFT